MRTEAEKEGNKIKKQNTKLRSIAILIENPVNKVNVKIVTTRKQYLKWSFRPTLNEKNNFVMEQGLSKKRNE